MDAAPQLMALVKHLSRASLEYVVFEALLKEAAEHKAGTPTLESVKRLLASQETGASPAEPNGGPSAPPATRVTLGKDKAAWTELTEEEKEAAAVLGYNELGWNEGIAPEACSKPWATLSFAEQGAATQLGYLAAGWDAEVDAQEAEEGASPAAAAASPPPMLAPPPVLTAAAATAAAPPSATPSAAPSVASGATLGKDKASWDELTERERSAATALGYNMLGWDEGIPPEVCSQRWASLSAAERTAASLLGYTAVDWDAELEAADAEARRRRRTPSLREGAPQP